MQTVKATWPPPPWYETQEERDAWRARPPEVISQYTEWRRATWEDMRDAGELVIAARGHISPRSFERSARNSNPPPDYPRPPAPPNPPSQHIRATKTEKRLL